jgi:hypothetical protein
MPRSNTVPIQIQLPPGAATNLAVAVVVFGMAGIAVVVGTALYGPEENSERAFRLLNWLKPEKTPDPEVPEPSPTARTRTRPSPRGKGVQAATLRP